MDLNVSPGIQIRVAQHSQKRQMGPRCRISGRNAQISQVTDGAGTNIVSDYQSKRILVEQRHDIFRCLAIPVKSNRPFRKRGTQIHAPFKHRSGGDRPGKINQFNPDIVFGEVSQRLGREHRKENERLWQRNLQMKLIEFQMDLPIPALSWQLSPDY
jgi:hypothetical protein